MVFSYSSWQDYPYTGRIKGVYIVFYQGGPIDHVTNDPEPYAPTIADSE